MAASNQILIPTSAGASFWNDDTVELHGSRLRGTLPVMPQVTSSIQTVRGQTGALIFLVYQVLRTKEKIVVMRAIASAMSCIHSDSTNYTGSQAECVELTGLGVIADDTVSDKTRLLETNFKDAEPVTIAEIEALIDIDVDELAAYFGVLCLAGVKRLTPENKAAFNEKRSNAVRAQTIEDLRIFTENSVYLDDAILNKVYASFVSMASQRSHMISLCAAKMGKITYGPPTAFAVMFMLLVDNGMGAIRIVKEAVLKYPWIRSEFPELKPELALANAAQQVIKQAPSAHRPFLKSIYGSQFVPMPYQETSNLVGICKETLIETTPTYKNYRGGTITPGQEEKLRFLLRSGNQNRGVAPEPDRAE